MKIFKKINYILIISVLLAVCVAAAGLPVRAGEPQEDPGTPEPRTAEVTLSEDAADALPNYYALRDALDTADGVTPLTVVVLPAGGTFPVDTTGAALKLRSRTTLDLNGCTLLRTGLMAGQNLLQNCGPDGENRYTGGYLLTTDITVQNGTLDGNEEEAAAEANLVNLGHADGVTLRGLTLLNVNKGHLAELSGCRNCLVEDCVFSSRALTTEALQLDAPKTTWNGVFLNDGTPCTDVTVRGCTFLDSPSGVGNHHALKGGMHNTNITIVNNTFLNTVEYDSPQPAVWCYCFEDSTVAYNTVRGYYSDGVKVSGGSVAVTGNVIALGNTPESFGITVTASNSYLFEDEIPDAREPEPAAGCSVTGNVISGYALRGITVHSGSTLNNITGNRVSGGGSTGILVTASAVTGEISGNTVLGCRYLSEENAGHGIHISSTASAKTITDNAVSGCAGYGIACFASDTGMTVTGNLLQGNGTDAMRVKGTGRIENNATDGFTDYPAARTSAVAAVFAAQGANTVRLRAEAENGHLAFMPDGTLAPWDATVKTGMTLLCTDGTVADVVVKGDIDGDGEATAADARQALRFAVEMDDPTPLQTLAACGRNNGTVTASDARMILRAAVGLERLGV